MRPKLSGVGRVFIIILIIVGASILLLWMLRKPIISFAYPSEPKEHRLATFRKNKVKIVQPGDSIQGKRYMPDSKVFLSLSPGTYKAEVAVDKKGKWEYVIPKNLKEGKHTVRIDIGINNKKYYANTYKIKVVFNRTFYKRQKELMKEKKKAQGMVSKKEKKEKKKRTNK